MASNDGKEREVFKAYITKYALTKGIFEVEVEGRFDISTSMVKERGKGFSPIYHNTDWHRTKESAVEKAASMKEAKIKSLKKQLASVEAKSFK